MHGKKANPVNEAQIIFFKIFGKPLGKLIADKISSEILNFFDNKEGNYGTVR